MDNGKTMHVSVNVSKLSGFSIMYSIILQLDASELKDDSYGILTCNLTNPSNYNIIDKSSFSNCFTSLGSNIYVLSKFRSFNIEEVSTLYLPLVAFTKFTTVNNVTTISNVTSPTFKYMDAVFLAYAK